MLRTCLVPKRVEEVELNINSIHALDNARAYLSCLRFRESGDVLKWLVDIVTQSKRISLVILAGLSQGAFTLGGLKDRQCRSLSDGICKDSGTKGIPPCMKIGICMFRGHLLPLNSA
jgi:hypothetical protein